MAEDNVLNEELAEAKRLALSIADNVVDVREHCAACAWVKLAACMVLLGVDDRIEDVDEQTEADDEDDESIARMERAQQDVWASSALRLYAVADSAMRQRWGDQDGARASAYGLFLLHLEQWTAQAPICWEELCQREDVRKDQLKPWLDRAKREGTVEEAGDGCYRFARHQDDRASDQPPLPGLNTEQR